MSIPLDAYEIIDIDPGPSKHTFKKIFFSLKQVLPEGKCGHRNVLSKRQVWMSIFHIINFKKKKKNHGHRGPGFLS